jgi:hypothetical protein
VLFNKKTYDGYFFALYPAGHLVPAKVLLFACLKQTIFLPTTFVAGDDVAPVIDTT